MTLASGKPPYSYDYGNGPFRVPNPYSSNFPIGLSGVLLEQAQFVITAEIRKFRKTVNSHALPSFNIYVNSSILPSGDYEPKASGSTLGNEFYPAAAFIIDHIQETRTALNILFSDYSSDTDLDTLEYRAAWFQSLYPNNPSGFYNTQDPDLLLTGVGHWSHRLPSEVGTITYTNSDVLGASGILYDVDIGELLINPAPHVGSFGFDRMHEVDNFSIQQFPLFPAFQKTDGSLIPLTTREPSDISTSTDYQIDHISSGSIRLDGYAVYSNTEVYLGRNANIFGPLEDFTVLSEGHRNVAFGGNLEGSRLFITPTSQPSGVYRIAVKNKRSDFPSTAIESGVMSFWPNINHYWPNGSPGDQKIGSTTTTSNLGYHVFDDCLWMTDQAFDVATAKPSGLCILSPFTGHKLWVRYAAQDHFDTVSTAFFDGASGTWPLSVGLVRISANNIYRLNSSLENSITSPSGRLVFGHFNDMLDFIDVVRTTSDVTESNPNEFPTSNGNTYHDFWHDPATGEYWVSNSVALGFGIWKFDSSFKYINKYEVINNDVITASGISSARGVFINGQHYLFHGRLGPDGGGGSEYMNSSGIFPIDVDTPGTEPYANDANIPGLGLLTIAASSVKYINGANFVGHQSFANILDIIEVTTASHLPVGIYALVSWTLSGTTTTYLLCIEEAATTWEIKSISRIATATTVKRDILYMPY